MTNTDYEPLLTQSYELATQQMAEAKRSIDQIFGSSYASKNPSLVGSFMEASAINFATILNQVRPT